MNHETSTEKDLFEEPALEDFLMNEEIDETDIKRKKRKAKWMKGAAGILAFAFLVNVLAVWVNVINVPALDFIETSIRLSRMDSLKLSKQAVVTIQGDGTKGTGFNIRENGLIVTNSHVVSKMNPIDIYFPNGEVFRGTILHDDPELDLAFVEISGDDLPVLPLQEDGEWKVMDHVYVIGNPLSFTQIANEGYIEGMTFVKDRSNNVLQISAPVYRGNSGSPVLNKDNKVIGVVYAATVPKAGSGERTSGLVVPIDAVIEAMQIFEKKSE
jgi:serine protease Do